jgi:exonuclease VII small subunit
MTRPEQVDGAVPVTELTYTEASRELDAIVGFFEQQEVDVDQLVVRLERATAIVDELDRRVRRTRAQVEELVPRLEAVNRNQAHGADGADGPDDADDGVTVGDFGAEEINGRVPLAEGEEGDDQALF